MWMRDAVLNDKVPSIKDLNNPDYFPYRYGQAWWSFLTGVYGDEVIKPVFLNTAAYGLQFTIKDILQTSEENLSNKWQTTLKNYYQPYLKNKVDKPQGKLLISEKNSGKMNVCPSMSPNGRHMIFLSEKDLFSTDLFLADVRTGEIIKKISSATKDGNLDNISYLESSGSWSPDGQQFVFIAFQKGKNVLVIKDADNGKTLNTLSVPGVDGLSSPTWNPKDKNLLIFSGMVEGQVDLFEFNLKTKKVRQLTNDLYSEILPSYNAEGNKIAFNYDKKSMDNALSSGAITYDIATMDLSNQSINILDVFHGAENVNPSFDHLGNIYFVSERDGMRNLYHYITSTGEVFQMTDVMTGISGITRYSPMLSVSTSKDKIMYTYFTKGGYNIYEANSEQMLNLPVDSKFIDQKAGALIIPQISTSVAVANNIANFDSNISNETFVSKDKKYSPKFKLDYLGGGGGVGVSTGNTGLNNTVGLQGGIDMLFSDILGNHQIFGQVALNGEILDIGGQFSYLNRSGKLAWGVGVSHIPLRTGYEDFRLTDVTLDNGQIIRDAVENRLNLIRVFDEGLNVFAHLPFSTTLRLEGGLGGSYRSFRWDLYKDYYQYDPGFNQYIYLGQEKEKVEVGDELQLSDYYTLAKGFGGNANIALVGDNSFFGLTSPLAGQRYRLGIDKSFGQDDYYSLTADYRRYFWMRPVSLSFRATSISRFENKVKSVFPYYIGQMGFVRGYGSIFSFDVINDLAYDFGQLLGSKMGLFSFEVRLPFTGPKQLALIGSNVFFTDFAFFFDAGVAFDKFGDLKDGESIYAVVRDENGEITYNPDGSINYATQLLKPAIARSVGISLRVNLFGAMILEPYYTRQLTNRGQWTFGLNFIPGW